MKPRYKSFILSPGYLKDNAYPFYFIVPAIEQVRFMIANRLIKALLLFSGLILFVSSFIRHNYRYITKWLILVL